MDNRDKWSLEDHGQHGGHGHGEQQRHAVAEVVGPVVHGYAAARSGSLVGRLCIISQHAQAGRAK
jgi:hypothetical protein